MHIFKCCPGIPWSGSLMNELLTVTFLVVGLRCYFPLETELKYIPSKLRRNRLSKITAGREHSTNSSQQN